MAPHHDSAALESRLTDLFDQLAQRVGRLDPMRREAFDAWIQEGAPMATASETLKEIIRARGLTAYTLAKMSGASVDPIQRFLNGERGLSIATFDKLTEALGLDLVERKTTRRRKATGPTDA
jgi:ribosome-binding protein aMBF1 (putative translation factor)